MHASPMRPRGSGLNSKAQEALPWLAKMVGANISSMGDGAPLQGAKNLRTSAFPAWYFKTLDTYTLCSTIRVDCI